MQHIVVLFILITLSVAGTAQIKRINYCECKTASSLNTQAQYSDSIFTSIVSDSIIYTIKIFNTTTDTVFLFSSYLQPQFFNSKYLHRIDKKSEQYKISFVPIIPFVFTKYSDVVATSNILVKEHQVVYDFVRMPPNTYYELTVPVEVFRSNNAVKDFDPKDLNKFDYKTKFKCVPKYKVSPDNYKLSFEFALYKDVSILCKESDYYLRESEFNKQAREFSVLQVPIK